MDKTYYFCGDRLDKSLRSLVYDRRVWITENFSATLVLNVFENVGIFFKILIFISIFRTALTNRNSVNELLAAKGTSLSNIGSGTLELTIVLLSAEDPGVIGLNNPQ